MKPHHTNSYEIYKSEVMGEALFGLAAKLTINAERKTKWQTLAKLELQTKNAYLEKQTVTPRYPVLSRIAGYFFGVLFAILPWKVAMRALQDGTQPLLLKFEDLLRQSSASDKAFYQYVLDHEKAIREFADRELQAGHDSLSPIVALLR